MAKKKKKRHEVSRQKKNSVDVVKNNEVTKKEATNLNLKEKDEISQVKNKKDDFKLAKEVEANKISDILTNKHIPIASRFYKVFWILLKDKGMKEDFKKQLFILFGGLAFITICWVIAILSLTGVIFVSIDGDNGAYFASIWLAIAVILGIII